MYEYFRNEQKIMHDPIDCEIPQVTCRDEAGHDYVAKPPRKAVTNSNSTHRQGQGSAESAQGRGRFTI